MSTLNEAPVPAELQSMFSDAPQSVSEEFTIDSYERYCQGVESPVTEMSIKRLVFIWPQVLCLLKTMSHYAELVDMVKRFVFYGSKGMSDDSLGQLQLAMKFKFQLGNRLVSAPERLFKTYERISAAVSDDESEMPAITEATLGDLKTLQRLIHAIFGINGESGELAKSVFDTIVNWDDSTKPLNFDFPNLIEEGGDTNWYLPLLANASGVSLSRMMQKNQAKLEARYGKKFSTDASENRDYDAEMDAMDTVDE